MFDFKDHQKVPPLSEAKDQIVQDYSGPARLRFSDGEVAEGQVTISYSTTSNSISGSGFFEHRRALHLQAKSGAPVLTYGSVSIRVYLQEAGMDGATIVTDGGPY